MAELNKEQFKRLFKQFLIDNKLVVNPTQEAQRISTDYFSAQLPSYKVCNLNWVIDKLWDELIGKGYG